MNLEYRLKRVAIGNNFLSTIVGNGSRRFQVFNGVPEDAKLVRVYPDTQGWSFWFVFESKEFDLVAEGQEIPELIPVYRNLEA